MAGMLESLATIAPLVMSGFGRRPETSSRVVGIQEMNRGLAEKQKLKAFGDDLFSRGNIDKKTVFELGKKHDVDPISAMKLVMSVFEANRAIEGRTPDDMKYEYYKRLGENVGKVSAKDQSYIDLNKARTGFVEKQTDWLGKPKPMSALDNERILTEQARRGLIGAQRGLAESRAAHVGKTGSKGRILEGIGDDGQPAFFRDTGGGLAPVPGARPKPPKGNLPEGVSVDSAIRSLQEAETMNDVPSGRLIRKFNRRLMENQQKGMGDPVTSAYDDTLDDLEREKNEAEYLKKMEQYLLQGGDD